MIPEHKDEIFHICNGSTTGGMTGNSRSAVSNLNHKCNPAIFSFCALQF